MPTARRGHANSFDVPALKFKGMPAQAVGMAPKLERFCFAGIKGAAHPREKLLAIPSNFPV